MGRILDLTQGTDDWLRWRQGGIGASDCATILHLNPYQNDFELYLLKTGQKKEKPLRNQSDGRPDPRQHGQTHEDAARSAAMAATEMLLAPVCMEHGTIPWMRASLDGYDPVENVLLEVKCPDDIRNHLQAREGRIPLEYYCQIQHQIAVACDMTLDHGFVATPENPPKAAFYSYWEPQAEGVLIWVQPEVHAIQELLMAEERFWSWIQAREYPMPQGERSVAGDGEEAELVRTWMQRKEMKEEADRLEFQARMACLRLMNGEAKLKIGDFAELNRNFMRGYTVSKPYDVAPRIDFKLRRLR